MASRRLRYQMCTEMYLSALLLCVYPFRSKWSKIIGLGIYTAVMTTVHSSACAITVLITTSLSLNTILAWKSQFAKKQWRFLLEALPKNPGRNPGRIIWYTTVILLGIASVHEYQEMHFLPSRLLHQTCMSLIYVGVSINSMFVNKLLKSIEANVVDILTKLEAEIETQNRIVASKMGSNDCFSMYMSVSQMDTIVTSYLRVLRGIQYFNELFGLTIVGLAILLTSSIANALYILFIKDTQIEANIWRSVLIKTTKDSISYLVYCFLYIEPCMKTTSHLDEAVKLTCRLSTKLPHNSTNLSYVSLQRKLDLLNKQLTSCKPYFSASGLFDVDYAIFSYIFAGISSVVIVYVQLM
ncbi:unnamed protein product [Acanthoscelides obtectus]|uniref:Gustatory receptor n=1 Tax=Acanthoscelides obtectus TaxID=200917 RepID=A0A9P0KH17_ACAOB|nr:unnamed protein product [Acanthoscelides obtectus]CAK1667537.1 hypothetical protein AOBTE_LOCUS25900 [Acanthoscelides obtectus]